MDPSKNKGPNINCPLFRLSSSQQANINTSYLNRASVAHYKSEKYWPILRNSWNDKKFRREIYGQSLEHHSLIVNVFLCATHVLDTNFVVKNRVVEFLGWRYPGT